LSKEEFDLFKCKECGFVFTFKYPDEQDISKYYESADYISHDDSAKGFLNLIYLQVRSLMLKKKRRIIEKATGLKKGKILDIGCGTGYFAATMKKGCWDVTGIEPNVKARDFATRHFAIEVISPEDISELPAGIFDCITLWHVMEHFHDPFSYAAEIKRLLRPGGVCFCALPNCSSFDANHYGEYWAAYDVPRHLWHFTPETFRLFAEKMGFHILATRPLPLDVFYISILSEKNKGSKFYFLKGTIKGTLFAFRSLFNKARSSSLIYFLRLK
jgi:2-polyprenyl-3-methyl-5-hydroxy-6-metoxy-1,4-benzoquinol methylase